MSLFNPLLFLQRKGKEEKRRRGEDNSSETKWKDTKTNSLKNYNLDQTHESLQILPWYKNFKR